MERLIKNLILVVIIFFNTRCSTNLYQIKPNIGVGGRAVAVSVDPDDDQNIIVASESGGLFLSNNRGFNWKQISGNKTFWFNDVLFLKSKNKRAKIVLAAAKNDTKESNGGGVYRSYDGGETWDKINTPFTNQGCSKNLSAYCLSAETGTNRVWIGTSCGLAFSDDDGLTWVATTNTKQAYAVAAPANNHVIYSTGTDIEVSVDGGTTWSSSRSGLPGSSVNRSQSQFAVSPVNDNVIFWTFLYFDEPGFMHKALYASADNGKTWALKVFDEFINEQSRWSFVAMASRSSSLDRTYDVFFGDGGGVLQKFSFRDDGQQQVFEGNTPLNYDHSDLMDMAFSNDKNLPFIAVGDGGIHLTRDDGLSWVLSGAGTRGYNALQVYEITGQLHEDGKTADVYFSTQDNYLWASPDNGDRWQISQQCCEGYYLSVPRDFYDDNTTRFSAYISNSANTFLFKKLLLNPSPFLNSPNVYPYKSTEGSVPVLLKPDSYIQQTTNPTGSPWGSSFDITVNEGKNWFPSFGYSDPTEFSGSAYQLAGDKSNPVIFIPVTNTIKRISGLFPTGNPKVISNISGFGSPGINYFDKHKTSPFAVNPSDPQQIIIADITTNQVKITNDGGATWPANSQLTSLVTNSGKLKFSGTEKDNNSNDRPLSQVTAFGISPTCPSFMIAGTKQAGIFTSSNYGNSWEMLKGSEVIPNVTSFFFGGKRSGEQDVFISSFGRGVWKFSYKCTSAKITTIQPPISIHGRERPLFYTEGLIFPLSAISDPEDCNSCVYFVVENGEIINYKINQETKKIEEIILNKGSIRAYSPAGQILKSDVKITYLPIKENKMQYDAINTDMQIDKELFKNVDKNLRIQGLLTDGNYLKGVILFTKNIDKDSLPKNKLTGPEIKILPDTASVLHLYGRHFNSSVSADIYIDGKIILPGNTKPDEKGAFNISIRAKYESGYHTVLVQQKINGAFLKKEMDFIIPGGDKH